MPSQFLYWEPSIFEPAGHVGLRIDGRIIAFTCTVARPDDNREPVYGFINEDERLEKFVVGLRSLGFRRLQTLNMRLPSGITIYQIIYQNFDGIKHSRDAAFIELRNLFSAVDPDGRNLGDQREMILNAAVELARWVNTSDFTLSDIIRAGHPDREIDISFLNIQTMQIRADALKRMRPNWYAKVGAKTDCYLNSGGKMRIPSMCFFSSMSGLRHYTSGQTRHNCSSFVLDILNAGGLPNFIPGDVERGYLGPALQRCITLNATSKGQVPDDAQLQSAGSIERLITPLWFFGYGKWPITDWFGTTPEILARMIVMAKEAYEPVDQSARYACLPG